MHTAHPFPTHCIETTASYLVLWPMDLLEMKKSTKKTFMQGVITEQCTKGNQQIYLSLYLKIKVCVSNQLWFKISVMFISKQHLFMDQHRNILSHISLICK